jgi:hypothetical protein
VAVPAEGVGQIRKVAIRPIPMKIVAEVPLKSNNYPEFATRIHRDGANGPEDRKSLFKMRLLF